MAMPTALSYPDLMKWWHFLLRRWC